MTQQHSDFQTIQRVTFDIIANEGPFHNRRDPNGKNWTITDLCILREWMNRNIRYQKDIVTHGVVGGQTGPVSLLQTRKEDCEDHGMLFGSMVQSLGGYCRLVSAYAGSDGHAFAEVCLGHHSMVSIDKVEEEIQAYHQYRADLLKIPKNAYICSSSSGLAQGWKLNNKGLPCRATSSIRYWTFTWSGVGYYQTHSGYVYLITDTLFGSYLGDISSFIKKGYRVEQVIDINRSSIPSLEQELGVDNATALKIVKNRPYRVTNELMKQGVNATLLRKIKSRIGSFDPRAPFWKKCNYKYPFPGGLIDVTVYNRHKLEGKANGLSPTEAVRLLEQRKNSNNQQISADPVQTILALLNEHYGLQSSQSISHDDKSWYYGPEKQKLFLTAEQMIERIQKNPAAKHFIYATGDWIDGKWVKDEWVLARDIPELRGLIDVLLQSQKSRPTIEPKRASQGTQSDVLLQKLKDEFMGLKNNKWMLIMEAKWFIKGSGEWHHERLKLVGKKIRAHDNRITNQILLAWIERYYSKKNEIVFPVSKKRKEIIQLFWDIYRTGQFPQKEFNGWVAQRGMNERARIPKRN